jgi:hypothetical protein
VKARVWKRGGLWSWEVRDDRYPGLRLTGGSLHDWREALGRAIRGVEWLAQG